MKIYTKAGDGGETGLFGGSRVAKDALQVEAYGTVDELNAALGLVRAFAPPPDVDAELLRIQGELFAVGADLASPREARARGSIPSVDDAWVTALEGAIDRWEAELPPLTNFVLPGGGPVPAALHVARATCRRAERRVVSLSHQADIDRKVIAYLNRLSDLLFVAARIACLRSGTPEVAWHPRRSGA